MKATSINKVTTQGTTQFRLSAKECALVDRHDGQDRREKLRAALSKSVAALNVAEPFARALNERLDTTNLRIADATKTILDAIGNLDTQPAPAPQIEARLLPGGMSAGNPLAITIIEILGAVAIRLQPDDAGEADKKEQALVQQAIYDGKGETPDLLLIGQSLAVLLKTLRIPGSDKDSRAATFIQYFRQQADRLVESVARASGK